MTTAGSVKTKRLNLIVRIIALFALVICAAAFNRSVGVKAADVAKSAGVFEMTNGASLRIANDGGIRFRVKMSDDIAEPIKNGERKLTIVIAPEVLFDRVANKDYANIEKSLEISVDSAKIYKGTDEGETDYWYANGVIVNVLEKNRKLKFKAVAYYTEKDGLSRKYTNNESPSRSLYGLVDTLVGEKSSAYTANILSCPSYSWYGTEGYEINVKTAEASDALAALSESGEIDLTDKIVVSAEEPAEEPTENPFKGKTFNGGYKNPDGENIPVRVDFDDSPTISGVLTAKVPGDVKFYFTAVFSGADLEFTFVNKSENEKCEEPGAVGKTLKGKVNGSKIVFEKGTYDGGFSYSFYSDGSVNCEGFSLNS